MTLVTPGILGYYRRGGEKLRAAANKEGCYSGVKCSFRQMLRYRPLFREE